MHVLDILLKLVTLYKIYDIITYITTILNTEAHVYITVCIYVTG